MNTHSVDLADYPPIMLAVPTIPWMYTDAVAAITQLQSFLPPGSVIYQRGHGTSSIAETRNAIALEFLSLAPTHGLDALLWIDSDMVPSRETAACLLFAAANTGADLVSALYFSRRPPFTPELQTLPDDADRVHLRVREVARAGFGCMLMQRHVLEQMPQPWFAYPHADRPGIDEDFYHCDKARALGMRVFVDFGCECGHLSVVSVTRDLARAYQATATGQRELAEREAFGRERLAAGGTL